MYDGDLARQECAFAMLRGTGVVPDDSVQREALMPAEIYLKEWPTSFGKIAHLLLQHHHKWVSLGLRHGNLVLESVLVCPERQVPYVADWNFARLCFDASEPSTDTDAVIDVVVELALLSNDLALVECDWQNKHKFVFMDDPSVLTKLSALRAKPPCGAKDIATAPPIVPFAKWKRPILKFFDCFEPQQRLVTRLIDGDHTSEAAFFAAVFIVFSLTYPSCRCMTFEWMSRMTPSRVPAADIAAYARAFADKI